MSEGSFSPESPGADDASPDTELGLPAGFGRSVSAVRVVSNSRGLPRTVVMRRLGRFEEIREE
jgi:hypothetical protein